MKSRVTRWVVAGLLVAGYGHAATTEPSFERYRVIIDRRPFGALPAADATAVMTPPAESFTKNLQLCTIIEKGDSIRVGFIDKRNNKSYMLAPGESQDGIELVSASFEDEEAVLRQGAEMAVIKLTSGAVTAISPAEQQARIQGAQEARQSYAERRRQRMLEAQKPPEPPPPPKYTGEELAKHLYEYQMEVIRQGLPPLPIPLTPEQDAQLVKEGVLPPQ